MRAGGDGHVRRRQIAVHRPPLADVDPLRRGHVTGDLAQHNHRLHHHLGLDPAVRTDREYVLTQLDLALDDTIDSQILTAVQL